jgi:protein-tyrosine phosphatase
MLEILPDIWISSSDNFKKLNTTSYIHINTCKDLEIFGSNREYKDDVKKSLIKYQLIKLYKYILDVIKLVHSHVLDNKTVVITCRTGLHISPLICVCYMIVYGKLTDDEALIALKSKVSHIYIDDIFFKNISNKMFKDTLNNKI